MGCEDVASYDSTCELPREKNVTQNGTSQGKINVITQTIVGQPNKTVSGNESRNIKKSKVSVLLLVCAVCAVATNIMLNGAILAGNNVIYVELVRLFGVTRTQASILKILGSLVLTCTSMLNMFFVRRFGLGQCLIAGCILASVGFIGTSFATNATQVICILGIVAAYGQSLIYSCSLSSPPSLLKSQKQRNALTTAILVFSGLGGTLGGPITSNAIETYGFSTAMIIFAGWCGLALIGNVFVWLRLRSSESEEMDKSPNRSFSLLIALLKNKTFVAFFCVDVIRIAFYILFWGIQVDHAYTLGFSVETAAFFGAAFGLGSICGRIINGVVVSVKRWHGINQFSITVITFGLLLSCMALVKTYYEVLVVSFIAGLSAGALSTFQYLLPYEIAEAEHYPMAIALAVTIYGISSITLNPLAGWIRDTYGTYDALFIAASPLCGVSGGLLLAYQLIKTYCIKCPAQTDEETALIGEHSKHEKESNT